MMRNFPTPARTSILACVVPRAPQPTITTLAWRNRSCPCGPIGAKRTWREYFSGIMNFSAFESIGITIRARAFSSAGRSWLRGLDLNQRPLGYEPNELPDCSTPQTDYMRGAAG